MTNERKQAALEAAMTARNEARGNPVAMAGFNAALRECCNQVDREAEQRLGAHWCGVITLHDKRVCDVGVFISARTT